MAGRGAGLLDAGELEDEGGGAACGFGGADVEEGGADGIEGGGGGIGDGSKATGGTPVPRMVEDLDAGVEDFGEEGLGEEAGAPGGDGIGRFELVADVGAGHPRREGFGGGVVAVGDFAEGESLVGEVIEDLVEVGWVGAKGDGGGGGGHGEGDGREWMRLGKEYSVCLGCQEVLLGFVWKFVNGYGAWSYGVWWGGWTGIRGIRSGTRSSRAWGRGLAHLGRGMGVVTSWERRGRAWGGGWG